MTRPAPLFLLRRRTAPVPGARHTLALAVALGWGAGALAVQPAPPLARAGAPEPTAPTAQTPLHPAPGQEPPPLPKTHGQEPHAPRSAGSESVPPPSPPPSSSSSQFNYALGVAYGLSPAYAGSSERRSHLRPVLALQYGRFRLSSSRGSAMLRHGLDSRGSGASATLVERERLNISAALRIDNGRDSADAALLARLPEVRSTLRARLSLGYALTDRWSLGVGVSQDLLGRAGGAQFNAGLQYAYNPTPATRVGLGMGASFGNGTFMRTQFGVPVSSAGGALAPFEPGAGLYSVEAGVGVMTALSPRWVAFGTLGVSQLRGEARRSPLTVRPTGFSASVGMAYRCCP